MAAAPHKSIRAPWLVSQFKEGDGVSSYPSLLLATSVKDSIPYTASQSEQPPPTPSSPTSRISPALLFIIVILAVIFFISGLLHLLVRLLIKKHPPSTSSAHVDRENVTEISGTDALQRQLQQLFHLHDSGLDQAFIDALPVFLYAEIVGSKEPFDCAVCLCEFAEEDKLRLLPLCGHAFHINCIDTWLLSNSTCPLCRGAIFVQGLAIENPIFEFEDLREEERFPSEARGDDETATREKKVFPVRLGKFKNVAVIPGGGEGNNSVNGTVMREEGESSSSSLDARRCFSMGSYQYVVADTTLQVALSSVSTRNDTEKSGRWKEINGHSTNGEAMEGKRLGPGSRRESFSVSKVWQWTNKKGKLPISSDASLYGGL